MYIRRSEDVLDVFWTSYVRSIYVLCLRDCRVIRTIFRHSNFATTNTKKNFCRRWAYSWALRQSFINNAKYESTTKTTNKKYRATCKHLLVGRRNFSVNARTVEQIIKIDTFKISTKINSWILMQIKK